MKLLELLGAGQKAGRIALRDAQQAIRYADLGHHIRQKAARLNGVGCAALAMDNCVDWVLWDLAALASGTTLVPIPPFFSRTQTEHALRVAGCSVLIDEHGLQRLAFPPVALPPGTNKITFTSGTTGTPKGVCLPQAAMGRVAASLVQVLGTELVEVHACTLPLAVLLENVAGVYAALMAGSTVELNRLQVFGDRYCNLYTVLAASRASSVILVPELLRTLMAQVMAAWVALPEIRFIAVGGARVDPALLRQARRLGLPVFEGYGLSECASVASLNTPDADHPGTVGRVLPHLRAHIRDGEVMIDNPGFLGYVGELCPGELATGDLGSLDCNGALSISGRKRNLLITSYGRNVSPEWVEAALLAQPAITQALVYGDGQPSLSALIVSPAQHQEIAASVHRGKHLDPDRRARCRRREIESGVAGKRLQLPLHPRQPRSGPHGVFPPIDGAHHRPGGSGGDHRGCSKRLSVVRPGVSLDSTWVPGG